MGDVPEVVTIKADDLQPFDTLDEGLMARQVTWYDRPPMSRPRDDHRTIRVEVAVPVPYVVDVIDGEEYWNVRWENPQERWFHCDDAVRVARGVPLLPAS